MHQWDGPESWARRGILAVVAVLGRRRFSVRTYVTPKETGPFFWRAASPS